ncbi:hypothetical protein PIB30_057929 [Stylosanthes scabra]|uniref:Uncharacterized protein n=1 Tax=Stylosanthes scabra TaxID=79078 RepID=A0ABU6TJM9_9FABA|nr:hypothetical protein [Stylosanthes scabra]
MAPKSRKRNASDAPSSSQRPNTPPEPTYDATSEVTVERAVLIHSIIEGLDIKAELLITENISVAAESKDQAKRLPFPSIIYRLLYANGIKKIDGDKLIPIERPITAESMTKNKYLDIQQEIQQQFPQHPPQDQQPPQVQQEQNQHDQTLPQTIQLARA